MKNDLVFSGKKCVAKTFRVTFESMDAYGVRKYVLKRRNAANFLLAERCILDV